MSSHSQCQLSHIAGVVGQPTNVTILDATATTVTVGFQVSQRQ